TLPVLETRSKLSFARNCCDSETDFWLSINAGVISGPYTEADAHNAQLSTYKAFTVASNKRATVAAPRNRRSPASRWSTCTSIFFSGIALSLITDSHSFIDLSIAHACKLMS